MSTCAILSKNLTISDTTMCLSTVPIKVSPLYKLNSSLYPPVSKFGFKFNTKSISVCSDTESVIRYSKLLLEFRDLVSRLKKLKEEKASKEQVLNNREPERVEGKAYGED